MLKDHIFWEFKIDFGHINVVFFINFISIQFLKVTQPWLFRLYMK